MSAVIYLRISEDLKDEIVAVAKQADVSINFVVEVLLRRGLGEPWLSSPTAIERLEQALERKP